MQLDTVLNFLKRPIIMTVLGVLVGLIVGLLIGQNTVELIDADASYLRSDLRDDYLRMTIDSLGVNKDMNLALQRWQSLRQYGPQTLDAIKANPGGLDPVALGVFSQMATENPPGGVPVVVEGTQPPASVGAATSLGGWVISIALFSILAVAVVFGFIFLRRFLSKGGSGEPTIAMQANEISRSAEKTDFEGLGLAPPITQTMTTYITGDDLYDESFSIDTQGGEFLGEYGVGVSETVGVGEPKKVTALEVWLFDKNDIKTATKVLMSQHAFNDPGIRGRLEPKGELVQVETRKQVILETETLQLLATVVDLQYGQGSLPNNSYFERLTLELAIWPKGE